MFSCEVCEIFKNTFLRNTSGTVFALPVAASAFFKKKLLNSYFAKMFKEISLLWYPKNFSSQHVLDTCFIYKKSKSFVYKFVVNCQVF